LAEKLHYETKEWIIAGFNRGRENNLERYELTEKKIIKRYHEECEGSLPVGGQDQIDEGGEKKH